MTKLSNALIASLLFHLLLALAFTNAAFASELSRLKDTFGDWKVRHVYDEESLQYRFSDAKTFLTSGKDIKLPAQINRTNDGQFEFRLKYGFGRWGDWGVFGAGRWVTKVAIEIEDKKFTYSDEAGMKVHEFITRVGPDFLSALAKANAPASVNLFIGTEYVGTAILPVKGSAAALIWLRAVKGSFGKVDIGEPHHKNKSAGQLRPSPY